MDTTLSLKNVAPGDYLDASGKYGVLVIDGKFYCNTVSWDQSTIPLRVRTQTLTSGAPLTGLAPGSRADVHYCAAFIVENNSAHWLDCDKITFKYATFASGGRPQASYVDSSDKISWDVFDLEPGPQGEIRSYSFEPKVGTKIRRAIFAGDGTLFDEVTFHNVVPSDVFAQRPAGGAPDWLNKRTV